jgi:hypothetical protein
MQKSSVTLTELNEAEVAYSVGFNYDSSYPAMVMLFIGGQDSSTTSTLK